MFKQLLISTMILSIFGSTSVFASSTNSNKNMTPKEEHELVIKKTKEVKSILKKLEDEHKSIKEINTKKEENINKLEKTLLDEQKELDKIKEAVKKEKERIEEKERLEKIQKEKELADKAKAEKAEQERIAKEKSEAEKAEQERIAKEKSEQEQVKIEQETVKKESSTTTSNSNTSSIPTGAKLTPSAGVFQGPSGKETYYNLPMQGVVSIAKSMGIEGDYWVRDDGVKMYGDYVMVAANLSIRPRGSLIQTSLGMGIVLDTGGFASSNPTQLDIATNW